MDSRVNDGVVHLHYREEAISAVLDEQGGGAEGAEVTQKLQKLQKKHHNCLKMPLTSIYAACRP